jgi:hypothetical protein
MDDMTQTSTISRFQRREAIRAIDKLYFPGWSPPDFGEFFVTPQSLVIKVDEKGKVSYEISSN